ncbi:MAG TPA: TonB-dependent receptor plug domain-containing protein, partial [Polyangiales bacterium]
MQYPILAACSWLVASTLVRAQAPAPAPPPADAPVPAPPPEASPPTPPLQLEVKPEEVPPEAPPPEAPVEGSSAPEPPAKSEPAHEEDDAMVVTGSRIKRSPELAKSAPVQILDRKMLERTGASNAADIIQTLTAAQGSGFQGSGNVLNNGGGALGTASVNLRGLGAGATLVLINGRRLVPSAGAAGQAFGDISVIPLTAIERIEVLKGGGSAIYGADAVGGVINIITRTTFNGVKVQLDGQGTTRADQGEATVSGSFGAKSDRSRVLVAVSYLRRSPLLSSDRPFSRAANTDSSGSPGTYVVPGFDPRNPMRNEFPDPGCAMAKGSMVVNSVVNGMPTADQSCVLNFSHSYPLVVGEERANGFASASYDLTDHTTAFAEFLVNHSRSDYVQPAAYPVPPPLLVVPANNVDNPFGRDVQLIGRPLGNSSNGSSNGVGDDTLRAVIG